MNGPFVVAQANSGGAGAIPVQVLKLIKPQAGHTDVFHASFTGAVKIDFTAIANEKITLFHDSKTQSLHVIFADGSQIIIEPFFDSRGTVLANLIFEMAPNEFYSGQEFAQKFPITEDQSVLPAAGDTVASGADFQDPSVDSLPPNVKLGLLLPEELPGLKSIATEAPFLEQQAVPPLVSGHLQFIVEEEELFPNIIIREIPTNSAAGYGNEDTNDVEGDNIKPPPGNDEDTFGDFTKTQKQFSGDFSGLVSGGGPFTFFVNAGADGAEVRTAGGVQVTSIGENVFWEQHGVDEIWGVTHPGEGPERTVFVLHIDTDGHFTFTLTDQIDHDPAVGGTPAGDNHVGNLEETIFLDLSIAVAGQNVFGLSFIFPNNTIDVGVIDDTPIVKPHASECATVDEDDIKTYLSHGTSPNDGNFPDGSFTGNPFGGEPGPAFICGDLSGLVRVGADAVYIDSHGKAYGTFSFNEDNLSHFEDLGLSSKGYLLEYHIEDNGGSQTLVATAASGSEGGYERTVFTLKLFSDGKYEFRLFDQMDHDPPHDFSSDGVSAFPGSDQNFDLRDTVTGDINKLNFGVLIEFSDYDHDSVSLDGAFTVEVRDDVPEVKCDPICLTVDEDDISTLHDGLLGGSLGASPKDGNADGSSTGNQFNPSDDGPATVTGKLRGLFGVVESGADEPVKFSFISDAVGEHIVEQGLALLGLKSNGQNLSYDIQGNILYAYVGGGGGSGYQEGLGDRLVFKFTLQGSGEFKFELFDQMDHDPPNDDSPFDGFATVSGSDENTDLRDGLSFSDVTSLDFGRLINATDFDGDLVNLHDKLVIKIRDDVPLAQNDSDSTGILSSATGNVITGIDFVGGDDNLTDGSADSVGTDEPGRITKLAGVTTDSDGSDGFLVSGTYGTLSMEDDGGYTYTRTSSSSGTDIFTYTLADGDDDFTTATLTINLMGEISKPNEGPVAGDDIIIKYVGAVPFSVPEWAFLLNDTDPDGNPIDITGVSGASGVGVVHVPGPDTNGALDITDSNAPGGTFSYALSDGDLSDSGLVTVIQGAIPGTVGSITGTSADEIIVGNQSGNGAIFDGAGGNDAIFAGDGSNTVIGGTGDDWLTGGGGNDRFVLSGLSAAANGHDTILDFVSGTDDIFVDVASQALTIGTAAAVAAGDFHIGDETNAATWAGGSGANEFVWNNTTKELWYSANGTGSDKIDLAHMSTGVPTAADVHTF